MLCISPDLIIDESEIQFAAIRAQGTGGQNVNKVATAIHLRFDINASSLPEDIKRRLRHHRDKRINLDGTIVIKAQRFRTQERNKADALERLQALLHKALHRDPRRIATKPSKRARQRRLDNKSARSRVKALRGKITD